MRLAICGANPAETGLLCSAVRTYCADAGIPAELCPLNGLAGLWADFRPGAYQGVLLGVGDTAGFLAARQLRERDWACRLVVIDDTERFAIPCLRLHAADFLVRPLRPEQLRRGADRFTGRE